NFQNVSISGAKFNDLNGNGVRDAGEPGLAGFHILLNGVDSATTDTNGNFTIPNVGPRTFTIQQVQQAGFTQTAGNGGVTVATSSVSTYTTLFRSNFQNVSISGAKFNDQNGNGVRDTGEPGFAGFHILLNGVDRATTDANG